MKGEHYEFFAKIVGMGWAFFPAGGEDGGRRFGRRGGSDGQAGDGERKVESQKYKLGGSVHPCLLESVLN